MKHLAEEQLVAFRLGYAEGDEARTIAEHLGGCEACRAGLDAIDATLSAVAQVPVPERAEGYGAEVWARIQPRLERPPAWRAALQSLIAPRRLAFGGAVAVLVLAAFVAGRNWPRTETRLASDQGTTRQGQANPQGQVNPQGKATAREQTAPQGQGSGQGEATTAASASSVPQVRQDVLLVAVGDHLERSQLTLAELVNTARNEPSIDISSERERARDLVVENRLYRQTAQETGDTRLAAALDDLERVLVEVANSPSQLSEPEFERVRQRIETQGTIFKVRVLGERVREQRTQPATAGGRIQG